MTKIDRFQALTFKVAHRIYSNIFEVFGLGNDIGNSEYAKIFNSKIEAILSRNQEINEEKMWSDFKSSFRRDIKVRNLNNFLNWPAIHSSMFHECDKLELDYLKSGGNWAMWRPALKERRVGNPLPYYKMPSSSGNLIHNAYTLAQLLDKFAVDLKKLDFVVEFGGGYGNMSKLVRDLGFRGNYVIYDLPEFSCLQEFYLKSAQIESEIIDKPTDKRQGCTILLSDIKDFEAQATSLVGKGLFLATWSLTESPLEVRNKVMDAMRNGYDYYLIAYHGEFGDVDNRKYINDLIKDKGDYAWHNEEIQHLKNNFLLLGRRNENS